CQWLHPPGYMPIPILFTTAGTSKLQTPSILQTSPIYTRDEENYSSDEAIPNPYLTFISQEKSNSMIGIPYTNWVYSLTSSISSYPSPQLTVNTKLLDSSTPYSHAPR
ncbi:unnamed protein product, partial [Meganyctiphanes norvegica]